MAFYKSENSEVQIAETCITGLDLKLQLQTEITGYKIILDFVIF